ncbi:hypothetical protein B0T21DRAFT_367891 [Apiosordaria backusii]|uniref:magnesium chelatase n=1 Tax=Apiosordaria backusii TaxID=314023 RepID=A0AA40BJR4_9PEZI|nr:hypothetical protein B0T21DRAFT_367891 [Apiosordaria backusii]
MADERLLDKIQSLSDLELATLLCLVAREHCLIGTLPDYVDELAEELRLVASKTFNLSSAIISCHSHTTLDEFATGLLVPSSSRGPPSPANTRSVSPYRPRHEPSSSTGGPSSSASYFPSPPPRPAPGAFSPRIGPAAIIPSSPSTNTGSHHHQPQIANFILAKDLNRAPRAVQIQALELLRTRRIFTRTSVQTAPKQFLFIALVGAPSATQARVTPHLNDFFYLSHWHDPEKDGFDYLDVELPPNRGPTDNDAASVASSTASSRSIIKRSSSVHGLSPLPPDPSSSHQSPSAQQQQNQAAVLLTEDDISLLSQLTTSAYVDVDVLRYQMNVVSFLRIHRAVSGGVTPQATKHFQYLCKSLAPLHGLGYVTPSLVGLAARKVYGHRLVLVTTEEGGEGEGREMERRERSMQWGSEKEAVGVVMEGWGAEEVVEDVLGCVGVPA